MIARSVAGGRIEWVWILASCLLLLTRTPLALLRRWSEKLFAVGFGQILKQRLFHGVLKLELAQIQQQGVGHFLAWILESETIEWTGLGGGASVLRNVISLLIIGIALLIIGEPFMGSMLLAWLTLSGLLSWRLSLTYTSLNEHYSDMANDLLERLRGHQTRLIQERDWYAQDDQAVAHHHTLMQKYDKKWARLMALIPNGWGILALVGIAITFIAGPTRESYTNLVFSFSTLFFGYQLFNGTAYGLTELNRAIAAWHLIYSWDAAGRHYLKTCLKLKRFVASWAWPTCCSGCRWGCSRWSASRAGDSRMGSAAGCTLLVPCCKRQIWSFWMRVSTPLTQKVCSLPCNVFLIAYPPCW